MKLPDSPKMKGEFGSLTKTKTGNATKKREILRIREVNTKAEGRGVWSWG